jgi:hypothetical protein
MSYGYPWDAALTLFVLSLRDTVSSLKHAEYSEIVSVQLIYRFARISQLDCRLAWPS